MRRRAFISGIIVAAIYTLFFQFAVFAGHKPENGEPKVKYVFLFIGDGMGQAQVNLTQAYLATLENKIGFDDLSFTRFPEVGFCSNYTNDQLITCSAAAGTALATGHKTNIGRIAMDPAGEKDMESIATKAKSNGFKVGILTKVSIDHATPAVFYAHQPDRDMYFEIGTQLTESSFDLFAGGGFLDPVRVIDGKVVDLIQLAGESGFNVVSTRKAFDKLEPGQGKTLILSPRLTGEASMPFYIDMDPGDLTLIDYTSKAIELLSGEDGFFMMVEGGKIDWACHGNDAAAVIQEVVEFSKSIEKAVDFYEKHPDETLIVVTADHETGGLALGNYTMRYSSDIGLIRYQLSSIEELYKIVTDFRAKKSGDPDADFERMMKAVDTQIGIHSRAQGTVLTDSELEALKTIFIADVYGTAQDDGTYVMEDKFIDAVLRLRDQKAGISWGSSAHTFINVPVYAIGPGAEKFSGYIDNTDIPRIIGEIMGIW